MNKQDFITMTLGDWYDTLYDYEITIHDVLDDVLLYHGDFDYLPIKFACSGYRSITINNEDKEIEVYL